jgi:hypothetical protein
VNIFLLTMQYDEELFLPLFLTHYSRYFPKKNIFVVDHGSSADLTPAGYNRIYVPRDRPYSEESRRRSIQMLASGLLEYYDAGIYADCDELIDLDTLDRLDFNSSPVSYVAGFDVFWEETPGGKRLLGLLNSHLCKPSIFSRTPKWLMGFHGCEHPPHVLAMPMAHIRYLYPVESSLRLKSRIPIHQSMRPNEKAAGFAAQWGAGDAGMREFHDIARRRRMTGAAAREFSPIDPERIFQRSVYRNGAIEQVLYVPAGNWAVTDCCFDLTGRFPALLT